MRLSKYSLIKSTLNGVSVGTFADSEGRPVSFWKSRDLDWARNATWGQGTHDSALGPPGPGRLPRAERSAERALGGEHWETQQSQDPFSPILDQSGRTARVPLLGSGWGLEVGSIQRVCPRICVPVFLWVCMFVCVCVRPSLTGRCGQECTWF